MKNYKLKLGYALCILLCVVVFSCRNNSNKKNKGEWVESVKVLTIDGDTAVITPRVGVRLFRKERQ